MQELSNQYEITPIFCKRYFERNALNRLSMEMLKFLYFKKGKFLNPAQKNVFIEKYTKEEISNFFDKKELNIILLPINKV